MIRSPHRRWVRVNAARGAELLIVDPYRIGWTGRRNGRRRFRLPWQAEAPDRTDLNAHRGLTPAGAARRVRRAYARQHRRRFRDPRRQGRA